MNSKQFICPIVEYARRQQSFKMCYLMWEEKMLKIYLIFFHF